MRTTTIGYEISAEAIIAGAKRQQTEHVATQVEEIKKAPARTVGRFTYDPATGTITGPAAYMASPAYRRRMFAIESGQDTVAQFGYARHHDAVMAILVSLQTDYAAWLGLREIEEMQRRGR